MEYWHLDFNGNPMVLSIMLLALLVILAIEITKCSKVVEFKMQLSYPRVGPQRKSWVRTKDAPPLHSYFVISTPTSVLWIIN